MRVHSLVGSVVLLASLLFTSCRGPQGVWAFNGALVGAGAGALFADAIGKSAGGGALIGAGLGAMAGGLNAPPDSMVIVPAHRRPYLPPPGFEEWIWSPQGWVWVGP